MGSSARRHPVLFPILALCVVVVAVEAIFALGLQLIQLLQPDALLEPWLRRHFREQVTEERIERYRDEWFDAELGWVPHPNTVRRGKARGEVFEMRFDAQGARRGPANHPPFAVATYGDSFVAGDEVADHHTWQVQLGARLNGGVQNLGVPGWGADQAIRRVERDHAAGRVAPVTIVGLYEDNLARAQNRFRPLLYASTDVALGFKPALAVVDGVVVDRLNLWVDPSLGSDALLDLAWRAAADDPFAAARARWRPPFALQVARLWAPAIEPLDAWRTEDGARIADHLVARLVASCRAAGSQPWVLWFPHPGRLSAGEPPAYADTAARWAVAHPELRQVDLGALPTPDAGWFTGGDHGHLSELGARALGDALADRLLAASAP